MDGETECQKRWQNAMNPELRHTQWTKLDVCESPLLDLDFATKRTE